MVDVPGSPYRALLRRAEAIEREVQAMLDEKRAAGATGGDLVSMLVAANREGNDWMTDEDLIGQVTIAFAASYETTANAMTWTLFLLAQHPEVAHDLLRRAGRRLRRRAAHADTLARAPLLEAVMKESLRILPPVPYTIRVARCRQTPIGPYVMLRGDRVILSHYVTHHLPELYPNPERFEPQRWLSLKRGPYEYLPFSAGPRLCIGYSFAMQALKLSTAMILQRFRFSVRAGHADRSHGAGHDESEAGPADLDPSAGPALRGRARAGEHPRDGGALSWRRRPAPRSPFRLRRSRPRLLLRFPPQGLRRGGAPARRRAPRPRARHPAHRTGRRRVGF